MHKGNCETRRETFKYGDLVHLMLEIWQYIFCQHLLGLTMMTAVTMRERTMTMTKTAMRIPRQLRCSCGLPTNSCNQSETRLQFHQPIKSLVANFNNSMTIKLLLAILKSWIPFWLLQRIRNEVTTLSANQITCHKFQWYCDNWNRPCGVEVMDSFLTPVTNQKLGYDIINQSNQLLETAIMQLIWLQHH